MTFRKVAIAFMAGLTLNAEASPLAPRNNDYTVKTSSGIYIGGPNPETDGKVSQWLGVPFGKSERFEESSFADYNSKATDVSTDFGPSCWGWYTNGTSAFSDLPQIAKGRQWDVKAGQSEDCLNLNVYAPKGAKNLPVMIWVHGGSFYTGSNNVPDYQGYNMAGNQDVVFVGINYRLSIFGYPPSPAINPYNRNLGLLDQRLAVEWAYKNIAAFGGNPEHMILFGESAGSIAVDHYSYAWAKKPIVKGLISESGSVYSVPDNSKDESSGNFTVIATAVGCNTTEPEAQLQCMKKQDAKDIIDAVIASKGLTFNIIIDERTVFSSYKGRPVSRVPHLMGSNDNEGVTFVPYSRSGVNQTAADIFMYKYLTCAMMEAANRRIEQDIPVWRYRYYGNFSNISPLPWMGAYHSSEIAIVMDTFDKNTSTPEEIAVTKYLQGAWGAFAKDPKNGLKKYGYPSYNTAEKTLIQLALENSAKPSFTYPSDYDYICSELSQSTCPDQHLH